MILPVIQGTTKSIAVKQTYTFLASSHNSKKQIFLANKLSLSNKKDYATNGNNQSRLTNSHLVLFQAKKVINRSSNHQKKTFLRGTMTKTIKDPKLCPLCGTEVEAYRYFCHVNMHPSKIFDWLFLGSYRNASELTDLRKLSITHILNCAVECRNNYPKEFAYSHLKLCDRPNFRISPSFNKAIAFLEEARKANGKVLVHCQMGISRSTTCVIAYMIKEMNFSEIEALKYVKKKRKIVFPNYGFMEQLLQFEKSIRTNSC